jgi:hypothetical protein
MKGKIMVMQRGKEVIYGDTYSVTSWNITGKGMAQILSTQVLLIATLLLADNTDATDRSANPHHFLYARVLGVYHANVICTGSGKRDVNPASSFAM